MKMRSFLARGCVFAAAASFTAGAVAEDLLLVDLTVPNQISISATSGLSAVTAMGSDGTGVYLENFYSAPRASGVSDTIVPGATLRSAENPGNGLPNLFTSTATDPGLNIFAWSPDTNVTFTAGSLAFVGTATWNLPAADYAEMVAGNLSGNLYFPADNLPDLPNAQILGQWRVIPEPASLSLLALGGLALLRRR